MPTTYVKRRIDLIFKLGTAKFGEGPADTVTVSGLRVSAAITKAGGPSMGGAQLQVFGMTISTMNQLSTLGMLNTEVRRNSVSISAGDDVSGMSLVFEGTIQNAFVDFQPAPEVAFIVQAYTGLYEAIKPVAPSSYAGGADVATILSNLARKMGLSFENNGVSVQLSNPYFPGSWRDQAYACAAHANVNITIDNGILAIWLKGSARGGTIPLVSPETGLVGYPAYNSMGISFRTLFNPSITHGGKIEMKSSQTPACGFWIVNTLNYQLDSEMAEGQWFSIVNASRPGDTVVQW